MEAMVIVGESGVKISVGAGVEAMVIVGES